MKQLVSLLKNVNLWAYLLFWSWNIIFLGFMLLGFAPLILPELVTATIAGIIPAGIIATALLLIAIPLVTAALGITLLRREPRRLFALGYAVEGPLMLLVAVRLFVVRELTPQMTLVLAIAAVGMLVFVWDLLDKRMDQRSEIIRLMRVVGLTLYALVAVYAGLWLAFYAIPAGVAIVRGLWEALWHIDEIVRSLWRALVEIPENLLWIPFMVFGMLSFAYSATLFVLMPLAVPILVLRAWWHAIASAAKASSWRTALASAGTVAVVAVLVALTNSQPQSATFALLENPPTTPQQAQALAMQEDAMRAGLLNAYLAPQRYISSVGEVQHIREIYSSVVGISNDAAAQVERAYEAVAAPLLYQPVGTPVENASWTNNALTRDSARAAELYAAYFDEEITEGEHNTVLSSVTSTWDVSRAAEARQTANDSEVHLNSQDLTIQEHGDWADVELHEVYQNETGTRQEVVYYVTLPESAAITGVWLGNSDNRAERAVYRVAPRGAAQTAYRNEVRRSVDPALVEQIGPRQYRIRVFPIEPRNIGYENTDISGLRSTYVKPGPPLHLWLTWRVMANAEGWTMPYLADKRNVYWDAKTVRTLNGSPLAQASETAQKSEIADWLPAVIPAATSPSPSVHRFDLGNDQTVIAEPRAASELPALPNNLHLAVVVDRSRSMAPHAAQVKDALERFAALQANGTTVDIYLSASSFQGQSPQRADPQAALNQLVYRGGQNPAELLRQYEQLRGTNTYDAVFVLTDGTGYALGATDAATVTSTAPVWFVHLDGEFPLGYDDATLETIQSSGGGVTGSLDEALNRLAVALNESAGSDWVDGYTWLTLPTAQADARLGTSVKNEEGLAPLAARRLILTNIQRQRENLAQLNTLDQLHAIAKQYSVVSPYSSMIVLINERQQQLLDELEKQTDRFARETEEVGDTQQNPFDVTAVPEPHEYLLLAIAALGLVWYLRSNRRARKNSPVQG